MWVNELLGGGLASPSALCIIHKIKRGLFNIMVQVQLLYKTFVTL